MTPIAFLKQTQIRYQQIESRRLTFKPTEQVEVTKQTKRHQEHEAVLYELEKPMSYPFYIRRLFQKPLKADRISQLCLTMNFKFHLP